MCNYCDIAKHNEGITPVINTTMVGRPLNFCPMCGESLTEPVPLTIEQVVELKEDIKEIHKTIDIVFDKLKSGASKDELFIHYGLSLGKIGVIARDAMKEYAG